LYRQVFEVTFILHAYLQLFISLLLIRKWR